MCDSTNVVGIESFQNFCGNQLPPEEGLEDVFNKFIPDDFWIYGINSPTSLQWDMQNALLGFCLSDSGFLCANILKEKCKNYTYENLSNSVIRDWCSCYLPRSEYDKIDPNTNVECFQSCRNPTSVKLYTGTKRHYCQQSSCIIDNISINSSGGRSGEVTFNQVCPSCPLGSCRCVVNDINLLGNKVRRLNVGQNCSPDSSCYSLRDDGTREEVDCKSTTVTFGLTEAEVEEKKTRDYVLISVSAIGIILTVLVLFLR